MSTLPATKASTAVARLRDDGEFDAVEIRQALFPIVRILRELDRFVLLELDELERAGADRMRAHLRGGDVARIDRRIAGREHRQQRRLRPLEMQASPRKSPLVVTSVNVADTRSLRGFLRNLSCALPCSRSKVHFTSLAVNGWPSCHLTPCAQLERELQCCPRSRPSSSPAPARWCSCCSAACAGRTSTRLLNIAHRRDVDREGRLLVDREAGRCLAVIDLQDPAMFRFRRLGGAES